MEVFGLGSADAAPPGATVHAAPRGGHLGRGLRALVWPFRATGDVILTLDPDTSLAARIASLVRRKRWVADVHEDYEALLRDRSWVPPLLRRTLQAAVAMLNRLISTADLVLVADDHVPPKRAARRFVMRNEPDFNLLPEPWDHAEGAPWRAVYIGDVRTSRGLRTMVEAVAMTADDPQPWHLDIIGPVSGDDAAWLETRLGQHACRHIKAHGRQDPTASWEIARGADVGLCLLENTPAFAEAMPSKVYEYLACGVPTIATPLPRVAALLRRTGAGEVVDGAAETAEALRRFATDTVAREALVAAAREAGEVARSRLNIYDEGAARILS